MSRFPEIIIDRFDSDDPGARTVNWRMPWLWWFVLLTLVPGCGSTPPQLTAPARDDPESAFAALEQRLLNAAAVRLDFHVVATGVFQADLRGTLHVEAPDPVRLTASGLFNGQAVDLALRSRGGMLELEAGTDRATVSRPPALNEALLVGLTRMGILHNLARLTGALPPDRADGAVREWVTVDAFADAAPGKLSFDIRVAGNPAGSAELEIGSNGMPVDRTQTVQFAAGEMRVVEKYSGTMIDP